MLEVERSASLAFPARMLRPDRDAALDRLETHELGGPGGPGGGVRENGKKNLQELAKQTGRARFEVGKSATLATIHATIEEELRSQ